MFSRLIEITFLFSCFMIAVSCGGFIPAVEMNLIQLGYMHKVYFQGTRVGHSFRVLKRRKFFIVTE